tara:strand:- start:1621 stop:2022 length:402 start_codon:yes stop_codon:yes gene_type:complete
MFETEWLNIAVAIIFGSISIGLIILLIYSLSKDYRYNHPRPIKFKRKAKMNTKTPNITEMINYNPDSNVCTVEDYDNGFLDGLHGMPLREEYKYGDYTSFSSMSISAYKMGYAHGRKSILKVCFNFKEQRIYV